MSAWRHVELARHPDRPRPERFVTQLIGGFVELCGDRATVDDPALLAGVGRFAGRRVAVAAQRPFVSGAGALRKVMRLVELAERFEMDAVCTFIDVDGRHSAHDGVMWSAVGRTIERLLNARLPVVAVLCGEGVSGAGAPELAGPLHYLGVRQRREDC